jgi:membrane-associated progesterone receptor component
MILGYILLHSMSSANHIKHEPSAVKKNGINEKEEEKPDPPRNFTPKQLRYYDGTMDDKSSVAKPVYLSLNGTVFDVSTGRNFYGPDGPYAMFAGRECGVALAKMSFNTEHLDDLHACKTLNHGERMELENWIDKFTHYKCYPIVGRLVPCEDLPEPSRLLTRSDLEIHKGDGVIPPGYAVAPIYVGAGGKVYDMSFGGVTFYGQHCPYHIFAGHDASRALAKMSLDIKDVENSDTSDLTEKEIEILNDWIHTFEERKGYPVVGILSK